MGVIFCIKLQRKIIFTSIIGTDTYFYLNKCLSVSHFLKYSIINGGRIIMKKQSMNKIEFRLRRIVRIWSMEWSFI